MIAEDTRLTSRAQLAWLIAHLQQNAPHQVPLVEGAYHGVIDLVMPRRESPFPAAQLKRLSRPTVLLLGDDDYQESGPAGWACRSGLPGWARFALVNGAGGDVADYKAAVLLALQVDRLVLVETGTRYGMAWHGLFARSGVRTVNLVTPEGSTQPAPLEKGEVH